MIPTNKTISVLHPYVNKRWWAVNMMIYLSDLLLKKENNVKFYTFSYDQKMFSKDINFEINCFNFFKTAYSIRNSDYIFIWNSPMQFVWVFSKIFFFSSAKLIWWHHHYPWYYSENTNVFILIKRYLEKFSINFIDSLVSNSLYLKKVLKEKYDLESMVLNPVLHSDFIKHNNTDRDFDSKIIFTYSRWVKWKNLKQVFDSYEKLKQKIPDLKLYVWWEGFDLIYFQNKFKSDNDVLFLWLLDRSSIIENLEKSLVFLFPSFIDSFWMTMIEAMSIWVPVVWFDLNSSWEIILDNKNWFLVDSDKEFTEKILLLLTDKNLHTYFSKNALELSYRYSDLEFEKKLWQIFLP